MYVCASSLVLKEARGGSQIPWNQRAAIWVLKTESAFSVRAAGALHCGLQTPVTSLVKRVRQEKGRKASLERFP